MRAGNVGAGSTTPTTSTARPSTRTALPTMLGSPPNRLSQNSCVSTITGGTLVPSSPSLSSRPSTGDSPITRK